ncbi:ribosomal protein RPL35 [Toxoplasma gondii TgCatPRC2]|uniref:Ribosomal protein RPL35 n=16 Tax=Toxoplasma gondii TaxID=5811 RepID=B9PRF5_TOXGV|nr:ribosomal protein RPL35 [Toxoplasma gondii ME49]EPR63335.1 ribosomal protein RPL35 [Toxoplasma gondii GT1]ESS34498.1 ribosomal protein RPL35 [Toxoplasma gondii VEG]KAF4638799.1 ribosomal protein RPL35 [Toxoplasma gondii]KFG29163.1 ribosomal protein RPL35 [Toxoplasma gondii p89]KFG33673.1 ribosomal protein RPL35 [Toxoplasma gondii FOU]KFG40742.1 ribosomal protein RPL35 [Toxoplasma gondii GAB2-2007-GAL-DOM2]KFG57696.1 ribosomal protein RPL35 [Toxoplasma gondii RUB]KFG99831.1 ribosomal prot|eukprot:XP_002367363.1 ribosomal protein RPL35 [Toxoplasma gondii ME49]
MEQWGPSGLVLRGWSRLRLGFFSAEPSALFLDIFVGCGFVVSLSASATSPLLCSKMVKIRAYELRGKSQKELVKQLEDLKKELAQLRVAKVTGSAASKLSKVTEVRKGIARVLTVYTQKQREEARAAFKGKKFIPNDLRAKKTRAIRRRLTASQTRKMTVRKMKRTQNVPKRKFALIA